MAQLLRAVAVAGGGTSVLWWLTSQQTAATITQPFEAPYFDVPATLPQAWPVDDVANDYMVKTRGGSVTQDVATVAAGACLWWAARADVSSRSACKTMPVFFTGADVNNATTHDAQQIFEHPEWIKLNYEYGRSKPSRGWYASRRPCVDGAPEPDQDCDEFPFFASEQGGPLASPTPHLQFIDSVDNQRQGRKYRAFIRNCGLRTGTPQTGLNSTGGTPFLIVPLMPALHIPTFWLCSRD